MPTRHAFALIVIFCTASQVGCCLRNGGCCGMGGTVYNGPGCGIDDCCGDSYASCGCPEASCCCPEATCACPDVCGCEVGCGTSVTGPCPLLGRLRQALNRAYLNRCGHGGCCDSWQEDGPCGCESCNDYGNNLGGPYTNPHGRRARMAKRSVNLDNELRFGGDATAPIYR